MHKPVVGNKCYIAETAVLIGDVTLGDEVCIMDYAVLRGDMNSIVIGNGTNIQDNVTLHTEKNHGVTVGRGVSIGHNAVVHGSELGDSVLVGMGAITMNGARIGAGTVIAAGSVVRENFICPENSLIAGIPATLKRTGDMDLRKRCELNAESYSILREEYLEKKFVKLYGRDL